MRPHNEGVSDNVPTASDPVILTAFAAAAALRAAAARGDEDQTYAVALEVRDQLRVTLPRYPNLPAAWETRPAGLRDRWLTLLAAFAGHEFETAGVPTPAWAAAARLEEP